MHDQILTEKLVYALCVAADELRDVKVLSMDAYSQIANVQAELPESPSLEELELALTDIKLAIDNDTTGDPYKSFSAAEKKWSAVSWVRKREEDSGFLSGKQRTDADNLVFAVRDRVRSARAVADWATIDAEWRQGALDLEGYMRSVAAYEAP